MHLYFLGLSLAGYDSLWGRMIRSGVVGSVVSVKQTGVFPNGDPLRTVFTGLRNFDQFLIPAVIFYNNILSNESTSDRMLLVSLFTTMQTTTHCMEHLFWGVFNQAWGAAAVYPLYCFTHAEQFLEKETDSHGRHCEITGPATAEEAFALIPTAVLGAVAPAMLLYPAFNSTCIVNVRQGLIAFYRFTPLALTASYPFFTWAQEKISAYLAWRPRPADSKKYVTASLMISGVAAVAGHAYALLNAGGDGVFEVFWPAQHIDTTLPTVIADGARDFLQWDIFIITAALVPFADLILGTSGLVRRLKKRNKWFLGFSESFIGRLAALTVASGMLSPGAVLAFALAARAIS
ncbi:Depudecin biosynthesis cluster protein 1 [Colletotrichum shisoi]|uniref:Depudecin biosynthesis cluster protein 1 n=1 Tax=Colletotrichum shisoi TaxID=2078593 RepID=A0A5Q4BU95_9PEZI|nr:Depudecin biosynthesis cluster protein 1 [Colletotrichum shisoi]